MRIKGIDRGMSELVDGLQVSSEHVRMLVIFIGDVVLNGVTEGDIVGSSEGQVQDVARNQSV